MTNEMKLITALCNALGFEVERVCVNQEQVDDSIRDIQHQLRRASNLFYPDIKITGTIDPIYEYKLIKKDDERGGATNLPNIYTKDTRLMVDEGKAMEKDFERAMAYFFNEGKE